MWFEAAIVMTIFAFGNIFFGHFEEKTPKWRRALKVFVFLGFVLGISSAFSRAWAMAFLAVWPIPLIVIHAWWLPKQGINGWTAEPKDKYYRFRGWTLNADADNARRWYKEVWVPGGETTVHELMADDVVGYMEGVDIRNRDEFLAERRRLLQAFPDLAIVAEDVIGDGAKVAVRWRVTATHKGEAFGLPPTHRRVSFRGLTWLEFKDGRIVLGWDSWNLGDLVQSLSSV